MSFLHNKAAVCFYKWIIPNHKTRKMRAIEIIFLLTQTAKDNKTLGKHAMFGKRIKSVI